MKIEQIATPKKPKKVISVDIGDMFEFSPKKPTKKSFLYVAPPKTGDSDDSGDGDGGDGGGE